MLTTDRKKSNKKKKKTCLCECCKACEPDEKHAKYKRTNSESVDEIVFRGGFPPHLRVGGEGARWRGEKKEGRKKKLAHQILC
jgi:hypothetical protein